MKTLFINRIKVVALKVYEYIAALCVLFVVLSFFSVPTLFKKNIYDIKGTVTEIKLNREYTWARTAGSKGYSDYYDIHIKGIDKPFICYSIDEIKAYGQDLLNNKEINIVYFQHEDYMVVNMLSIDDIVIVKKDKIGVFPFILFVGLGLVTFLWSIWGVYLTYFVSDKKRKEILGV